jgi:hypothetical protein
MRFRWSTARANDRHSSRCRSFYVIVPAQKHADPPCVRKNVMGFCISARDKLISYVFRKGNIHPVDVPEFSLA